MVQIVWSQRPRNDLKEISDYISQDSPENAEKYIRKIIMKTRKLVKFPQLGRVVLEVELSNPIYRELIYDNYRIIYQYFNNTVEIISILHGKRMFDI